MKNEVTRKPFLEDFFGLFAVHGLPVRASQDRGRGGVDRCVSLDHGRLFLVHETFFPGALFKPRLFSLAYRMGASRVDAYEIAAVLDPKRFLFDAGLFS